MVQLEAALRRASRELPEARRVEGHPADRHPRDGRGYDGREATAESQAIRWYSASPSRIKETTPITGSDQEALALARIRQLSAHEVGHTIGLEHNFAASTYGRASVMDYPAPLVTIRDGRIDLSDAYTTGVGVYDLFAIKYGYAQFAPGADEAGELAAIVREGLRAGLVFVSDDDSRPAGAAHPLGNLWDDNFKKKPAYTGVLNALLGL